MCCVTFMIVLLLVRLLNHTISVKNYILQVAEKKLNHFFLFAFFVYTYECQFKFLFLFSIFIINKAPDTNVHTCSRG